MSIFSYSEKSTEEIFSEFKTSARGLPEKEAQIRLLQFGKNEIVLQKWNALEIFFRQFKSPFVYLLFGAAVVSLFLREFVDTLMIIVFLAINGFLGFYQEYKSEKIIEKLKSLVKEKAKVYRNEKIEIIDRSKIVKGDIVFFEKGDILPADVRIINSESLTIDESALTGESAPVAKNSEIRAGAKEIFQASNLAFWGTSVVSGSGEGVVVATGKDTQIGEISELAGKTERRSGFEQMVLNFSKFVLNLVFATLSILFFANLILKGFDVNIGQTLLFTLALAVSVVPEALPVITTITLSRGALKLSKKHVVIKRLSALEDLGNIEVLCSDKTGTLTENKLDLKDCISLSSNECFSFGAISATGYNPKTIKENQFDFAIWRKLDAKSQEEITSKNIIWRAPFDPARRLSDIVVSPGNSDCFLVIKGAPEEVFKKSKYILKDGKEELFATYQEEFENKFRELGENGFRTLAVAFKKVPKKKDYGEKDEKDSVFLGMFSFYDPLKSTAKEAILGAERLKIEVKIITGDSLEVAEYIAKEAGILKEGEHGTLGADLENMSNEKFSEAVMACKVFARISPEMKYRIIQEIQKHKPVGFLGEGINDAPALKLANVAIVVQSGADVSKEASDVIMLHKDLKVIIDGIYEGRKIYANIIKYIKYTLAGNFGNFYAIAGISLIIPYLPMLPSQILLTNLLSDLPLVAIANDRVDGQELRKPGQYNIRDIALVAVILGLVSSFADFAFFGLFFKYGEQALQTMWFIESILAEIVLIFSIRTRLPILKAKPPTKILIFSCLAAVSATIVLPFTAIGQNMFHFVRPTANYMSMIAILIVVYFLLTEAVKVWYYRSHNHSK